MIDREPGAPGGGEAPGSPFEGPAFVSLGGRPARAREPCPADERRRRLAVVLAALLLLLLLVAAAGVAAWRFAQPSGMEPNVVVGAHPSKSPEQAEAEQKQKIAEGMIGFSVNTRVVLSESGAPGDFAFGNPPGNGKRIKMRLVRDDDGETLLETGLLDPGTYLAPEPLDARLEPGEYACTAYVDGYRDDGGHIGQVAAGVSLEVRGT